MKENTGRVICMKFGHRVHVTSLFAPTAVTESGSLIGYQGPTQPEAGKELGSLHTARLAL